MTHTDDIRVRKPLRAVPPHVRLLALPRLSGHEPIATVDVSVPQELTAAPVSLMCYSGAVTIELPDDGAGQFGPAQRLLVHPEVTARLTEPLNVVRALALWDEVVREQGIFPGNIYLASEQSVANLLAVVGAPTPEDLAELLESLHALELLYRFPVAYKFRGEYTEARQCRLNGWGRLLFRLLRPTDVVLADWRQRLTDHLTQHRGSYDHGVRLALGASDDVGVTDEIHAGQPVPVLI